ncbi:hypothetical protein SS50377_27422 [Spironucleus salmonicida]|uniref:Uncharacterized protein n=1 Tax=Spironucleus salmonicida TaxID=348837 RepID=V6LFL6_9EUKA|nr:hypothetical protein SS50377_27422 [Spironucleus salmonicida]|eukprot:EST43287.1 Hypothetical protein SS50377_16952 [Spironucleus salmonicida]
MKHKWQENFPQALALCLQERLQQQIISSNDVFQASQNLTEQQRRGIWVDVGQTLDIKAKQAHDYFHNTYVKQFYENITHYKSELVETLQEIFALTTAKTDQKKMINDAIAKFYEKYPHKKFHLQTVYSFLYHQLKNVTTKIQTSKQQSSKIISDQLYSTQKESIFDDLFQKISNTEQINQQKFGIQIDKPVQDLIGELFSSTSDEKDDNYCVLEQVIKFLQNMDTDEESSLVK